MREEVYVRIDKRHRGEATVRQFLLARADVIRFTVEEPAPDESGAIPNLLAQEPLRRFLDAIACDVLESTVTRERYAYVAQPGERLAHVFLRSSPQVEAALEAAGLFGRLADGWLADPAFYIVEPYPDGWRVLIGAVAGGDRSVQLYVTREELELLRSDRAFATY